MPALHPVSSALVLVGQIAVAVGTIQVCMKGDVSSSAPLNIIVKTGSVYRAITHASLAQVSILCSIVMSKGNEIQSLCYEPASPVLFAS